MSLLFSHTGSPVDVNIHASRKDDDTGMLCSSLPTFCCAKQLRKSGSDIRMKVYTCLTMFTECIQLIQANSTSNYIHNGTVI